MYGSPSTTKNKWGDSPKAGMPTYQRHSWFVYASLLRPVRVRSLIKPVVVTMKQVLGKECVSTGPQGNQGAWKVTGGADFPTKPTCQLVWERVVHWFEGLHPRARVQCQWLVDLAIGTQIVKHYWVVRKTKGMWWVVLCGSKDHAATESAHRGRFSYRLMVSQLHVKESTEGSIPSND